MEKILFLGYVVPKENQNRYSGISIAGNKMQWNVVKNLFLNNIDVFCVTIPPYSSFPNDKKIVYKKKIDKYSENLTLFNIGFCNIPVFKQLSQIRNAYKEILKIINKEKIKKILCFNLFPQVGNPLRKIKKRFPNIEITCLLADLPIDDKSDRSFISKIFRKKFEAETIKNFSIPDKFIVLNKYVIDYYNIKKPFIVVDGGIDEEDIVFANPSVIEHNNVMFSGALTEYNGILYLLKAFEALKEKQVYLDIYGSGPLEDRVKEAQFRNKKIRFHGRLSNVEILNIQRNSWLLINPRDPDNLISKLTFPSKTFEYLLSGRPILSTKLNGYSCEYKNYIFFCDYSVESIEKAILQLLEGKTNIDSSRNFQLINKKKWSVQIMKIIKYMDGEYEINY